MEYTDFNSNAFKEKKLLLITHDYYSFTKDQIEAIAPYFKQITVLVRYKPVAEIANILPIERLKPFTKKYQIVLNNLPSNISVIPISLFYFPTDLGYKKLGEQHYHTVDKLIKRQNIQFDLIHVHFLWSAGYVGAKLKEKYDKPFIITGHGYDVYDLPFRDSVWRQKIETVLDAANHIITVSRSNREYIRQLNTQTPLDVISNGFKPDLFFHRNAAKCREFLNLPQDKAIILSVGNLVKIKGHRHLVEAMQDVLTERQDILCLIVGGGALKTSLERQIRKARLQNYVKLVGVRPHSEIPLWMNACDLFVLPSLNESFGVVQIEAMACGKPVVATNTGGSQEVITAEDYGFLVETANSQALAEKIVLALTKLWDAEKIMNYAAQYTWQKISKKLLEIYHTVITNHWAGSKNQ